MGPISTKVPFSGPLQASSETRQPREIPVPKFEVASVDVFGNIVPVNGSPVIISIFGGDNNESASSDSAAGTVNGIATFTGYILVNLNSPTPQSTTLDVVVSLSPLNLVLSTQLTVT